MISLITTFERDRSTLMWGRHAHTRGVHAVVPGAPALLKIDRRGSAFRIT
jgi:hypothetical protein